MYTKKGTAFWQKSLPYETINILLTDLSRGSRCRTLCLLFHKSSKFWRTWITTFKVQKCKSESLFDRHWSQVWLSFCVSLSLCFSLHLYVSLSISLRSEELGSQLSKFKNGNPNLCLIVIGVRCVSQYDFLSFCLSLFLCLSNSLWIFICFSVCKMDLIFISNINVYFCLTLCLSVSLSLSLSLFLVLLI